MAKGKKTGGRTTGTPNKINQEMKPLLKGISEEYLRPNPDNPGGVSDLMQDLEALSPYERVQVHLKLMEYHTPKEKAATVNLNTDGEIDQGIEAMIAALTNPQK